MEVVKLEDVVGLKFQFFCKFENSEESGEELRGKFVCGGLNLLGEVWERELKFFSAQVALQEKKMGSEIGNFLFSLSFDNKIVNVFPSKFSEISENNSEENSPDNSSDKILLIEDERNFYVFNLVEMKCEFIYSKAEFAPLESNGDKFVCEILSEDLLLVGRGKRLRIVQRPSGEKAAEFLLPERVKFLSGPSAGKILVAAERGKVFLLSFRDREFSLFSCKLSGGSELGPEFSAGEFVVSGCFLLKDLVLLALITPTTDNFLIFATNNNFSPTNNNEENFLNNNLENNNFLNNNKEDNLEENSSKNNLEKNNSSKELEMGQVELEVQHYCANELFLLIDQFSPPNNFNSFSENNNFNNLDNNLNNNCGENKEENLNNNLENNNLEKNNLEKINVVFKFVERWGLFFVCSDFSSSTLILCNHPTLIKSNVGSEENSPENRFHLLLMKEGCSLESDEFEDFVADVGLVSFSGEVYRKNALADTPLLQNPTVAALVLKSGKILCYCADVWSVSSTSSEEILPNLFNNNNFSDKIFNNFNNGIDNLNNDKRNGRITNNNNLNNGFNNLNNGQKITEKNNGENSPNKLSNFNGKITNEEKNKFEENDRKIGHLYERGAKHYAKDPRRLKLLESLANSLDLFESALGSGGSVEGISEENLREKNENEERKLRDYKMVLKKLEKIQGGIFAALQPRFLSADFLRLELEQGGSEEQLKLAARRKSFAQICSGARNFRLEKVSEKNLREAEDSLLFVHSSLQKLLTRLHSLNGVFSENFLRRLQAPEAEESWELQIDGEAAPGEENGFRSGEKNAQLLRNLVHTLNRLYTTPPKLFDDFSTNNFPQNYEGNFSTNNNFNNSQGNNYEGNFSNNYEENLESNNLLKLEKKKLRFNNLSDSYLDNKEEEKNKFTDNFSINKFSENNFGINFKENKLGENFLSSKLGENKFGENFLSNKLEKFGESFGEGKFDQKNIEENFIKNNFEQEKEEKEEEKKEEEKLVSIFEEKFTTSSLTSLFKENLAAINKEKSANDKIGAKEEKKGVFGETSEKLSGYDFLQKGNVEQKSVFSTFSQGNSLLEIANKFSSSFPTTFSTNTSSSNNSNFLSSNSNNSFLSSSSNNNNSSFLSSGKNSTFLSSNSNSSFLSSNNSFLSSNNSNSNFLTSNNNNNSLFSSNNNSNNFLSSNSNNSSFLSSGNLGKNSSFGNLGKLGENVSFTGADNFSANSFSDFPDFNSISLGSNFNNNFGNNNNNFTNNNNANNSGKDLWTSSRRFDKLN